MPSGSPQHTGRRVFSRGSRLPSCGRLHPMRKGGAGLGLEAALPRLAQTRGRVGEAGGRGGGEPSRASFRADLGRREQLPMHPSPASPPSCHLGLESHHAAPVWTSRSCGAGQARDPSDSKKSTTRRPRKQSPVSILSGPEPGFKWCSQGDRIHTAGIWGAPTGAALSPTPCCTSCAGEPEAGLSETLKGSPRARSEGP